MRLALDLLRERPMWAARRPLPDTSAPPVRLSDASRLAELEQKLAGTWGHLEGESLSDLAAEYSVLVDCQSAAPAEPASVTLEGPKQ